MVSAAYAARLKIAGTIDTTALRPFCQSLPRPVRVAAGPGDLTVHLVAAEHRFHPDLPPSTVWTYTTGAGPDDQGRLRPLVLEAVRGRPARVHWSNELPTTGRPLIDLGLTMSGPGGGGMDPYATGTSVTHLHGGAVPWTSDGHPVRAPGHVTVTRPGHRRTCDYGNDQPATALWFHDHTMGATGPNVYAGLVGMYLLREPAEAGLPDGDPHEIPLILGDRTLAADGRVIYGATFGAADPDPDRPLHRFDQASEFKGDLITVNGAVWPFVEVEARFHRFRVVNAATSRFFRLVLRPDLTPGPPATPADVAVDPVTALPIVQIGGDGGLLPAPLDTADADGPGAVIIAPGERADLLIDFAGLAPGTRLVLASEITAESDNGNGEFGPFTTVLEGDGGDLTVDGAGHRSPQSIVMQFRVVAAAGSVPPLPAVTAPDAAAMDGLRAAADAAPTRRFRVIEIPRDPEPAQPRFEAVTGLDWYGPRHSALAADVVRLGDVEVWELTNVSPDTHPIHLHLVQFLALDRRSALDGTLAARPGAPLGVDVNELGWKDTLRTGTGQITRFAVRFTGHRGRYVWHCHILEHEDMGMMRPLLVL